MGSAGECYTISVGRDKRVVLNKTVVVKKHSICSSLSK